VGLAGVDSAVAVWAVDWVGVGSVVEALVAAVGLAGAVGA
jgi:hypothetical protein